MQIPNYDRDSVCSFFKKLTGDIQFYLDEMKSDFAKNPPQTNIKDRVLLWKDKYQQSLNQCIMTYIMKTEQVDVSQFQFKEFLDRVTDEYQNDQEFMDLLKQCNQSIENLKDFIRTNLAKDPSIYVIKDI
ncbi:unnamed protein product (macronuclear) [Paramecium tetraurelia]|uniref:Uncharacterized protein n=1 Tax=Paramecium tetraurelia TaxID=5888 RepID=A0DY67_PARTE|nr:uncharacterized protein GSPATT00002952001 [Paramecium tetraurelia]CAK87984.1 unnamed protein product [Paramecium tetraurelia]|eukprot:XP_001455381.1 hypothetical protein (macronuclear) [Paramecium tetraurelia strain d4-2]